MDWTALGIALSLCVTMAAAEGVLSAQDLPQWLASLKRPRLYAPLWIWIAVAIATYLIQGFVAYRLARLPMDWPDMAALAALASVMGANVAYNVVLGRSRSPRVLFTGVVWFLPLLLACQVFLVMADPLAASLHLVYAAWVVVYDLPIMHATWRLNS